MLNFDGNGKEAGVENNRDMARRWGLRVTGISAWRRHGRSLGADWGSFPSLFLSFCIMIAVI